MTAKWNMIVDVARCDNCRGCFLAVKDEHVGNDFPGYAAAQPAQGHKWLDIRRHERGSYPLVEAHFVPVMCNHCDDAPCMQAAKDGAITKRPDGIVIIDPVKSKGQRQIVDACPYGAITWNDEKQIPQAWIFDAHLLDEGWTQTRAEQCCPTGVFKSMKVEDEEMQRIRAEQGLEVLKPELGTKPRIYYKTLHLATKCFVGGSVVKHVAGVEECAAGAEDVVANDIPGDLIETGTPGISSSRICSICTSPASPPAASAQHCSLPRHTARAPSAIAFSTSVPR